METLDYLKTLHEMWKLKCTGLYDIKKFLFFKDLDLKILTKEKIVAASFNNEIQYTAPPQSASMSSSNVLY